MDNYPQNIPVTPSYLEHCISSRRSSMDHATMKVLSIHLPAMLPPTSTELNVPHNVQVAAILGVGLMFQETAHRHTAEILLAEIGKECLHMHLYLIEAALNRSYPRVPHTETTKKIRKLTNDTLYHNLRNMSTSPNFSTILTKRTF